MTTSRLLLGVFDREEALLDAVRAARAANITLYDAFTPYAVHGLDEAMGVPRSRLPWITFVAGFVGVGTAALLQYYTSAVAWPLNVGGKPFASWPAFGPVIFELGVLFAGLATVAAMLLKSGLIPGRKPVLTDPGVTHDRFVLALAEQDGSFDRRAAEALLREHGAIAVRDGGVR